MNKVILMIYISCSCLLIHPLALADLDPGVIDSNDLRALLSEQKILVDDLDAGTNQRFGNAVSISGNQLVVGAYNDNLNGTSSGSVFVFEHIDNEWIQVQKLNSDDAASSDEFGSSVSIEQNRMVIGARSKNIEGMGFAGAVYVFESVNNQWVQTKRLTSNPLLSTAQFGYSVSLSGNQLLVGAPSNGAGKAYVFTYDTQANDWFQSNTLTADDGGFGDRFGQSVSLYQGRGLVGANKSQADNTGAAYVFESLVGNTEQVKLTASDGVDNDDFGISLSLFADRALVGASQVDGIKTNNSGSAYVFDFDAVNEIWQETEKLTANDAAAGDEFGYSVGLYADKLLVGSWGDDDGGSNTGSAYFFDYDGEFWVQSDKLTPTDSSQGGREFGRSVYLTDTWASVGAPRDSENGTLAGAAYIYQEDIIFISGFNE